MSPLIAKFKKFSSPGYFFFIIVMLLFVNTLCQWPYAIRFTYSPLNYWCAALLNISLPISIILTGFGDTRQILKTGIIIGGSLLLIAMLFISLTQVAIGISQMHTNDDDLILQDSLSSGTTIYRIYLDQGQGAFTPPFTVLRKERDIMPGVKLVRNIWADEHYGAARLQKLSDSVLEVTIDGDFFKAVVAID